MNAYDLRWMRETGMRPEVLICSFLGPLRNVPGLIMSVTGSEDPRLFYGLSVILAHDGENVSAVVDFAERLWLAGVRECECWNVFEDAWVSVVSVGQKCVSRVPPAF